MIESEPHPFFGDPLPRHQVGAEAVVDAPAELAYAINADNRDGHPRIIPRPPFIPLEVEQGGTGAGTVIRFRMRVLGRVRTLRAAIAEPEPGRVPAETERDTGTSTTFTVVPSEDGRKSRVLITTDIEPRGGPLGHVGRSLITRPPRPVSRRELERLGAVASGRAKDAGGSTKGSARYGWRPRRSTGGPAVDGSGRPTAAVGDGTPRGTVRRAGRRCDAGPSSTVAPPREECLP